MEVSIFFYDKKGNFKEEEFSAQNMNQLESNVDLYAEKLEKKWGHPVSWRVRNNIQNLVIVKVKIKDGKEEEFSAFLNEEGLYFKPVRYTKELVLWRIDLPLSYERERIENLDYVLRVSEMEMIQI